MSGAQRDFEPRWVGLAWISPWLLGLVLFLAYPIGASLYFSTTDYPLLEPPVSVGVDNYTRLGADPVFWKVVRNTMVYAAVTIPLATVFSVLIAMALSVPRRGVGFYRTAIFIPSLVPVVAAAIIWQWMYNGELGLINQLLGVVLRPIGLTPPNWLGAPGWAMTALILMSFWGIGPAVVIYIAALKDVPGELYEAAAIDGMRWRHRLWNITLPLISPVILFNIVIAVINAWQVFAVPYVMTGGGPDRATYFYTMYLYDAAFSYGEMGYASALAWVQLLLILTITAFILGVSRRLVYVRGS